MDNFLCILVQNLKQVAALTDVKKIHFCQAQSQPLLQLQLWLRLALFSILPHHPPNHPPTPEKVVNSSLELELQPTSTSNSTKTSVLTLTKLELGTTSASACYLIFCLSRSLVSHMQNPNQTKFEFRTP